MKFVRRHVKPISRLLCAGNRPHSVSILLATRTKARHGSLDRHPPNPPPIHRAGATSPMVHIATTVASSMGLKELVTLFSGLMAQKGV